MLDSITKREPQNGRAWRNLGLAYDGLKNPDRAIEAYRHALDVQPAMVDPIYRIALAYAVKQETDHVFEWLNKAKITRKIDMTQIEVSSGLAPFKSDPRFAGILPKAADFDNPLLEPVKIHS